MKKSEIVNYLIIEGNPRQIISNTITRMQHGGTINYKKKTDRLSSWTPTRKNQLKRLANSREGVNQRRTSMDSEN